MNVHELSRFSERLARRLFRALLLFQTRPPYFLGVQYLKYATDPLKSYTTVTIVTFRPLEGARPHTSAAVLNLLRKPLSVPPTINRLASNKCSLGGRVSQGVIVYIRGRQGDNDGNTYLFVGGGGMEECNLSFFGRGSSAKTEYYVTGLRVLTTSRL